MDIDDIKKKYKEFVNRLNTHGIPLPVLTDPKSGRGSVSYTMMWISFNLCVIGIIGKYSKALDGIDMNQAQSLFYACAALYWGRGLQNGKNGSIIAPDSANQAPVQNKEDVNVKVNVNNSTKQEME